MMISYKEFGFLRLAAFLPEAELAELDDWEFEDEVWVGEALGFSEWLRLKSDPDVLRSLAIDFAEFPADAARFVLQELELPIQPGMSLVELDQILGPRVAKQQYLSDRISCDYLTPEPNRYRISCTVLNDGGLTYLVVMAPPIADPHELRESDALQRPH